jgi:RHS repeat-associated protein
VISEESQTDAGSDGSFLALYVHDPGKVVGSILARGFMFGGLRVAQYYQDQIGSTRMTRNNSNELITFYEYDPYGNALTTYGTESFNYYRFTGAELDKDSSNFYSLPYRYYAPGLQRWMMRDPAGMVDGTNTYAYVMCSPVSAYDPLGLEVDIEICVRRVNNLNHVWHTYLQHFDETWAYDQDGVQPDKAPDRGRCVTVNCCVHGEEDERDKTQEFIEHLNDAQWDSENGIGPWVPGAVWPIGHNDGPYNPATHNCNSFTDKMLKHLGCQGTNEHFPDRYIHAPVVSDP